MPHLNRKMQRSLEDNKKNLGTTIQTFAILSQQNKEYSETFKLHNIYKRFTMTVVSDLKKVISK